MKKTWLSYPLWLVYAIFTAMSAAAYFSWFSIYVWGIGQNWTAIWICLMFCGIAGVWFAGHRLACRLGHRPVRRLERGVAGRRLSVVLEALLVLGLCTAAVFCRMHLLSHFDGEITGGAFYDMALVGAGGKAPGTASGVSYLGGLYTSVLFFVLSFAGNKVAAGVILQLVLQTAALFIFYFAGKLLAGRGEAICALGVMAFAPGLCQGILSLTPEMLYFLLYVSGMLLCGLYGKKSCCAGTSEGHVAHRKKGYAFAVACGFYIGYVGFLDITGWTLLLPASFACRKQQEAEWKKGKKGKNTAGVWGQWAVCALASLAAAFLYLGIHASAAGYSYGEALSVWLEYPVPQMSFSVEDVFWQIGAEPFSWMGLLICLCGSFNIIGFWPGKTQKQDFWIVMLLFFLVFQIFCFGGTDYGIFLTAAEGILAGIGICSMGKWNLPDGAETEALGTGSVPELAESEPEPESMPGGAEAVKEEKKNLPDEAEEEPKEEKPKVKLLDNPLPLPKKHVKRVMSYAKDVDVDEMDFDFDIKEDDDFDI